MNHDEQIIRLEPQLIPVVFFSGHVQRYVKTAHGLQKLVREALTVFPTMTILVQGVTDPQELEDANLHGIWEH